MRATMGQDGSKPLTIKSAYGEYKSDTLQAVENSVLPSESEPAKSENSALPSEFEPVGVPCVHVQSISVVFPA